MNMNEIEKEKLIEAVNRKFPHNNITELYYNIGKALPFTAQRFPGGRNSPWYHSQFVQVVKVVPGGKYLKYGKSYGFYYRNGVRADSTKDGMYSWCKKDDTEPKEIPNCGCGGWKLLDIQGEPTVKVDKVLELDDIVDFGKYRGRTLRELVEKEWNYVEWVILSSKWFYVNVEAIENYHKSLTTPK